MWWVYIVRCADNSLYTGIARNIDKRIEEHNENNSVGSRYTRTRRPVVLVYKERVDSRSKALRREVEIKKLSRNAKQRLIAGE